MLITLLISSNKAGDSNSNVKVGATGTNSYNLVKFYDTIHFQGQWLKEMCYPENP